MTRVMVWLAIGAWGCQTGPGPEDDTVVSEPLPPASLRRLSVTEYDAAVHALLGVVTTAAHDSLPPDPLAPFDNITANQQPSAAYSTGLEVAALRVAGEVRADPAAVAALWTPCQPTGPADEACIRAAIQRLARRALRRELRPVDVDDLVGLGMAQAQAYSSATEGMLAVVEALLQDPEFVFRFERGTLLPDDPTVLVLDDASLASRMSFFLWGEPPDDALLDAAAAGKLSDPAERAVQAWRMLADPRAVGQVQRFHEQWLGYHTIATIEERVPILQFEANQLVRRVVFDDNAPWTEVLLANYSYMDPWMAAAYRLPYPEGATGPVWVEFPEGSERSGLLAQAAFAGVASNMMDTSPTKRGKLIRERLMCQVVAPPPSAAVAASPPDTTQGGCKADLYAQHRLDPACAACHAGLDGIGFGLERFDAGGLYRDYDYFPFTRETNPDCPIEALGDIPGVGTFSGPRELATLLTENELVQGCVARTALTWGLGEALPMNDEAVVELTSEFRDDGWHFLDLLVDVVESERFARTEYTP
jgi:hypothetical protein